MSWESLFARAAAYDTTEASINEALRAHRGDDVWSGALAHAGRRRR